MKKFTGLFIGIVLFIFFTAGICTSCDKKDDIKYVNTRTDFCSKVNTDSIIYVDDIDFGGETESEQIKIEKSISIIGKSNKSVLKNVYFDISGGGLESEMITVSIQNVVFNGNYNNENLTVDSTKSYVQNMGSRRDEKRAINAEGFMSLSIDNCDFTNYNSSSGAAVYANYTDGNLDLYKRMSFTMSNCNVYNNYTFRGSVHFNGKKPMAAEFKNCNFYNNQASYASGIFAGGVVAKIDNCSFKNNVYQEIKNVYETNYVTREKTNYVSGQALHFTDAEGVVTNSVFENNIGYTGGAISSHKSLMTVDSCKFLRNTAENNGGAISVFSKETMPTYITNCTFIGNKANKEGNIFCNANADYVYRKTKASKVEFSLCIFLENNGNGNLLFYNDTSTYKYIEGMEWRDESVSPFVYNIEKDDNENYLYNDDTVEDDILGSIVIDKYYVAKDNSYTQSFSYEQAIALNIIDEIDFNTADSIKINKGSKADVIVPIEIASTYANGKFKNIESITKIGVNDFTPPKESNWIWWVIGSFGFVGSIVFVLVILHRRKVLALATISGNDNITDKIDKTKVAENSNIEEILKGNIIGIVTDFKLSQRESDVMNGLIDGKIAKQIAVELFISFDTARYHIKNLYKKLDVHSQTELISFCHKYKKID